MRLHCWGLYCGAPTGAGCRIRDSVNGDPRDRAFFYRSYRLRRQCRSCDPPPHRHRAETATRRHAALGFRRNSSHRTLARRPLDARRGATVDDLRTARSRAARALPDCARSLRELPGGGRARTGRRGLAALHRGGVRGLSALRLARGRLRAIPLRRMRPGSAGGVFVLSAARNYEESAAACWLFVGSSQGLTPDSFWPVSQAMSLSSTWNTPRRSSGGKTFSIASSFSVGSARR